MQIEILARKLEPLAPNTIKRWQRTRALADPDIKTLLDKQLISIAYKKLGDFHNKPLFSLPPESKAKGPIRLGTILYEKEKWSVGIKLSELLQNLAIFGRSGAGKTNCAFIILEQLIQRKIPFLFWDWKKTVRHILPRIKQPLHIYTPGQSLSPFPFNPFICPPGIEPHVYVNHIVDVMADAYTLGDGAKSLGSV